MPDQIEVGSIRGLEELEAAIRRFSSRTIETLEDAEQQIARKRELLDQIVSERARSASYWRHEYGAADPDEDDVSAISHRLDESENDLQEAKRWQRRIEDSYASYQRKAADGVHLCADQAGKACAILREKIKDLNEYVSLRSDGVGAGADSATVLSTGLTNAPANSPAGSTQNLKENRDLTHKQNYLEFMAQFLERNIEFKETGRTFVDASDIMTLKDGDNEWNEGHEDFWRHHGNAPEFYDSMAREYPLLRERLAAGESVEQLKLDPKSKTAAEFWWSTSDQIKLTKFKDSYFVEEAGFHRVALAKKNSLGEIPCLVKEATLKTP
ncbi:MAG: hypothetical protein WAQ99_08130 [Pyrinomonadaceae bacterium]